MVAIATPMNQDGSLDHESLEGLIEFHIKNKTDVIVSVGTTGESATLNFKEHSEVIKATLSAVNKRIPVIAGSGANSTSEAIELTQRSKELGADGAASPYYNKPTQAGIIAHYNAYADASPKPVILYNVPGRTSSNMLAETTLALADHKNIIAVKEASGNLDQVGQIIKNKPSKFLVLSGDDPLIIPHMALGGDGIISVIANAFPNKFSSIAKSCFRGDYNEARKTHYLLIDFIYMLFAEGNPGGVKAACHILGLMENELRLPLVRVSDDLLRKLKTQINMINSAG